MFLCLSTLFCTHICHHELFLLPVWIYVYLYVGCMVSARLSRAITMMCSRSARRTYSLQSDQTRRIVTYDLKPFTSLKIPSLHLEPWQVPHEPFPSFRNYHVLGSDSYQGWNGVIIWQLTSSFSIICTYIQYCKRKMFFPFFVSSIVDGVRILNFDRPLKDSHPMHAKLQLFTLPFGDCSNGIHCFCAILLRYHA
jgi:hypothetical protein